MNTLKCDSLPPLSHSFSAELEIVREKCVQQEVEMEKMRYVILKLRDFQNKYQFYQDIITITKILSTYDKIDSDFTLIEVTKKNIFIYHCFNIKLILYQLMKQFKLK